MSEQFAGNVVAVLVVDVLLIAFHKLGVPLLKGFARLPDFPTIDVLVVHLENRNNLISAEGNDFLGLLDSFLD